MATRATDLAAEATSPVAARTAGATKVYGKGRTDRAEGQEAQIRRLLREPAEEREDGIGVLGSSGADVSLPPSARDDVGLPARKISLGAGHGRNATGRPAWQVRRLRPPARPRRAAPPTPGPDRPADGPAANYLRRVRP